MFANRFQFFTAREVKSRAAVGMGIPMGIPMGMSMVWVWGLWWIPMGLWEFCGDFWIQIRFQPIVLNTVRCALWLNEEA